jgi:sulfoxide reductase heme-binding subunit YedZ
MRRPLLWALLAAPGLWWISRPDVLAMDLLEPSGDMAVRLMVLAMMAGPCAQAFGGLRWWLRYRRDLGLGAFFYGLLHLGAYGVDSGSAKAMLAEIGLPGIWTGWLGLALMLPPALTSADRAMRALGRAWKAWQRFVYPAVLVVFAHWLLLEPSWAKAVTHGAPLALAWAMRGFVRFRRMKA